MITKCAFIRLYRKIFIYIHIYEWNIIINIA